MYTLPAHATIHVTIYNFDSASGLRNPLLGRPTGLVGQEIVDGKPLVVMPPDQPSHTFAVPALGVLVPIAPVADDAKNTCDYRPMRAVDGAPNDHVHVQNRKARSLPLAVLRSVRRRLHVRIWGADADDRLHGRLPERGLAVAVAHGKRFVVAWLVLSAIATPLVAIFLGPAIPPGNGSAQATGQVFDNTVLISVSTPVCVFVLLFLGYVLSSFRSPGGAVVDGPPIRGDSRIQLIWIVLTTVTVLCLAGFGTYELVQNGAGGGQGPDASVSASGVQAGARHPGDRSAVGVHVPVPDVRRRRGAAPRATGSHAHSAARDVARRDPFVLGVPARRQG